MKPLRDRRAEDELRDKIGRRDVLVGIIGLGYVGMPLAAQFARCGYRVLGFDVSDGVVAGVNAGVTHIKDVEPGEFAAFVAAGAIRATTDFGRLAECETISVCVPTPLGKTRDPDVSYVVAATEAIAQRLRRGQLIILESTTYPGTTRELMLPMLEAQGLRVGEDFFLCFSPERVDPGNERWHVANTPKVIGGITPRCLAAGVALYERAIEQVVPVSSTEAAELTKLLENTFRAVNIALVNEMAQVADRLDVDVFEVIEAAATKPFGFMKFTPGPGIGGHCIPLDPHYLAWKMKALNYKTRMIELAGEINSEMPHYVVDKVQDALNEQGKAVRGSRILLLGVAYKRDIDDVRESPSIDVMRLLRRKGADVVYHDPYIPELRDEDELFTSVPLNDQVLASTDCVVITTDHSVIDYAYVVGHAVLVIDTRNATREISAPHVLGLSGGMAPVPAERAGLSALSA